MADYYDVQALKDYIRANASKYGLDPDTALKVWGGEGLKPGIWQSNVVKNGVREPSYGPFQFYMGGGMGNQFQSATGLDPRDPKNVYAMADYAMAQAGKGGWSPWYAARNQGISQWQGIGGRTGSPTVDVATMAPGPSQPVIQAASDVTKVPTRQDLINKAVQLSTRRGEDIPGEPGAGPSRGRLMDYVLGHQYVGQPTSMMNSMAAANPPVIRDKPPVPAGFTSLTAPASATSAPNIVPASASPTPQTGSFDETKATPAEISAYNAAHGTKYPTDGGMYTRGSLGLPPIQSNLGVRNVIATPPTIAPTANAFIPPNPNSMPAGYTPPSQASVAPSQAGVTNPLATLASAQTQGQGIVPTVLGKLGVPSGIAGLFGHSAPVPIPDVGGGMNDPNMRAGMGSYAPLQGGPTGAPSSPQGILASLAQPSYKPEDPMDVFRRLFGGNMQA